MKRFKKYLGTGLLVTLPIILSLYLIFLIVNFFDKLLTVPLDKLIGFHLPGLGLVIALLLVVFVGMFSSHYIGKKIASLIEKLFTKIPIVKKIYIPIRDIVQTFFSGDSNGKKSFSKVVFLDFPMDGSKSVGFITNEDAIINGEKLCAVFIPTTPNPTNGFLVYKKYEQLEVLDIPVEEGLNMVISMSTTLKGEVKLKEEEK